MKQTSKDREIIPSYVGMGMGLDVANPRRFKQIFNRKKFLAKVFTPKEITYCSRFKNYEERFAGKYAAKEAVIKALSEAYILPIPLLRHIEILNRKTSGVPYIRFLIGARSKKIGMGRLISSRFCLSISHISGLAVSVCVVLTPQRHR